MVISIHQPAFNPWLGYFDKLLSSDVFVFLDNVQFEKNSFINRNKVKTNQGEIWLTLPVKSKGYLNSTLRETELIEDGWRRKQLKLMEHNYKKAPYFSVFFPVLEEIYRLSTSNLADFCFEQLKCLLKYMELKKEIIRAKDLEIGSTKSDLVLDICKQFGATKYISGSLGVNYLELEKFKEAQIEVQIQNYQHPIYPQMYGDFLKYMGIFDFLMNSRDFKLIQGS